MLEDYSWLQSTWNFLLNAEKKGMLSQVYLFKSQERLGARILIEKLTKGIFCVEDGIIPCSNCRNCILFDSHNHPDIKRLELLETNSTITIDAVRQLIDFFSSKPTISEIKIAIIDPVNDLNISASNAMLKLLEEPPANTVFLLNWENPAPIPRTLISRCQQISVPSPTRGEVLAWLGSRGFDLKKNLPRGSQLIIGSPLELLDQLENSNTDNRIMPELLSDLLLLADGYKNVVDLSEKYFKQNSINFLENMESLCHAIATLKYSKLPKKLFVSQGKKLTLQTLSDKLKLSDICKLNQHLFEIKWKCCNSEGIKSSDVVESLLYNWLVIFEESQTRKFG